MPFSFSASTPAEQRQELRSIIAGDIIVSAQAPDGHPLRDTHASVSYTHLTLPTTSIV